MNERTRPRRRRPYSPPELLRVELKPEESLGTGCKTNTGGGGCPSDCKTAPCLLDYGS